jgi:hypothetical protein
MIYVGSESYSFHLGHCLQSKIRLLSPIMYSLMTKNFPYSIKNVVNLIARATHLFFPENPQSTASASAAV